MIRYFLELSYCGKNYHGWQRQPKATSVQEILERAVSTLLVAETGVTGAGRTDAGVHARQMFGHFDSATVLDTGNFKHRLNAFLPKAIAVRNICEVHGEAHARFDATVRSYEYWIHTVKDPFLTDYSYYFYRKLDIERMNAAAKLLLKYNDFECFSKTNTDVKTYLCKVFSAAWEWHDERLVFRISADRFLRNMVRAIVGTLLDVGCLKLSLDDVKRIIALKKRAYAGASVPAHGLYLTKVTYPSNIFKYNE